jgi:sporulation protein YlmC with PRC-barrel domain
MIRKLMASCAVVALVSTGALTAAQAEDTPAKPAVVQQDATGAEAATTELAETSAALTPDRPTLVSVFVGSSVYSSEDPESDNIGEINDLIVNEEGSITHAIVGVGGFLGIGEKDVAVPFDELKLVEEDGNIRLIYAATREQLEATPALDRTAYRRLEHPADEAAAENTEPAAAPADQQAATSASEQPAPEAAESDQAATAETEATKSAEQETAAAETKPAVEGEGSFLSLDKSELLASSILGQEIYGPDDQAIGEVSDLILQEDGKTRAAIVDVGGFLGLGEKTVAIPFEEIKVVRGTEEGAESKLAVALTKDQLEGLPEVRTDSAGTTASTTTPTEESQLPADVTMADDCSAAWVSADANKDGTLDTNESARYLAALRVADQPLADDAALTQPIFIENCRAGYFDTVSAEAGAPFEGANSFTEGQAQDRILASGFTNVSALSKDDKGIWRGTAEADGKQVHVAVDYKGNVVTTDM